MKKIFLVFVIFFYMISCKEDVENCFEIENGVVTEEIDWELYYNNSVIQWAEDWDLSDEWIDWMIDNRERYINPFKCSRNSDKNINVSFWYYGGRIQYNPPWQNEDMHMEILEELVELHYPTWDFEFIFGDNIETSDIILYANSDSSTCCGGETNNVILVHYETIFSHEFSHFVGNHHHYDSEENYGNGENMPPGESKCLMDRNSLQFCSACRFALDIPLNVDNNELIHNINMDILSRYP